jgi:O-antigen/teichoic acid export membrane protein
MLSKMEGNLAVGLYSAAYKLVDPILFIPGALASTLMPLMSKHYISEFSKLKRLYLTGSKYIILLMLPLTIGLFLLSEKVFGFLYTEDYFPAILTFQILSLTLVFNSVNSIQNSLLVATDRQKVNTVSVGICCTLNIILNLILIPIYSYNGAAIATLISVITLFSIQLLFIKHALSLFSFSKEIYKIVLASLLMGALILIFPEINFLIIVSACIILYALFLYWTQFFSQDDILMFKLLLRKD